MASLAARSSTGAKLSGRAETGIVGAGPVFAGGFENSGRASSIKEKVGIAEESITPRAPGTVGVGGCIDSRDGDGWTSAPKEEGIAAYPASFGTVFWNAEDGVLRIAGSGAVSANNGRVSCRNENAGIAADGSGELRAPGIAVTVASGEGGRTAGAAPLSRVPVTGLDCGNGCASIKLASSPGTAGGVGLGATA